jgi:hypothetical protein
MEVRQYGAVQVSDDEMHYYESNRASDQIEELQLSQQTSTTPKEKKKGPVADSFWRHIDLVNLQPLPGQSDGEHEAIASSLTSIPELQEILSLAPTSPVSCWSDRHACSRNPRWETKPKTTGKNPAYLRGFHDVSSAK